MATQTSIGGQKDFDTPALAFGGLNAAAVGRLASAAADITLVLDADGVIRDAAHSLPARLRSVADSWIGKRWADTVAADSRLKIAALLEAAQSGSLGRWREINHSTQQGQLVVFSYLAVRGPRAGTIIAFGRDLAPASALQQRLIAAEQTMEREYARFRQGETRYRTLVQMTSAAILIIDGATHRVIDANPAAANLFGRAGKRTTGWVFADAFDGESSTRVWAAIHDLKVSGRASEISARIAGVSLDLDVSMALSRQERSAQILVCIRAERQNAQSVPAGPGGALLKLIDRLPDGMIVADADLRILGANAAAADMAQMPKEDLMTGESLERWLGRSSVDLAELVSGLREHGAVRHYPTIVRGEFGASEDVDVSAAALDGDPASFGFSVRGVTRRQALETAGSRAFPQSVERMTELVGRVPMKDIVREATDWIERLSIEAALTLAGDNRASAADMLGLSRQSLYVKLRRYGIGDLEGDGADGETGPEL